MDSGLAGFVGALIGASAAIGGQFVAGMITDRRDSAARNRREKRTRAIFRGLTGTATAIFEAVDVSLQTLADQPARPVADRMMEALVTVDREKAFESAVAPLRVAAADADLLADLSPRTIGLVIEVAALSDLAVDAIRFEAADLRRAWDASADLNRRAEALDAFYTNCRNYAQGAIRASKAAQDALTVAGDEPTG